MSKYQHCLELVTEALSEAHNAESEHASQLAQAADTITRLTQDLAAAKGKLDLVQPSIDRLTTLCSDQSAEVSGLRSQLEAMSGRLNAALEQLANAGIAEGVDEVETPLLRAAESLAIAMAGNEWQKRAYLRKRGWRSPEDRTWDKPPLGACITLQSAVEAQARADGRGFAFLLEKLGQVAA